MTHFYLLSATLFFIYHRLSPNNPTAYSAIPYGHHVESPDGAGKPKGSSYMWISRSLLIAGLLLASASPSSAQIKVDPKGDPTSRGAWSGGMMSGGGTFMSVCTSCHGDEGNGDGVLAESLGVPPRVLSDAAFMSSVSDDHLFKVIKEGGASVGLTENMTPFAEQLSDKEIRNVILYLRNDICKCSYGGK